MTAIIETRQLTKHYGGQRGIIDVDLEVWQGEVFGLLGPSGTRPACWPVSSSASAGSCWAPGA